VCRLNGCRLNTTALSVQSHDRAWASMKRSAWDSYRNRRTVVVGLAVGYLPCAILISFVSGAIARSNVLVPPFALVWLAAYLLAGHRMAYFPCPRCGMPFFYRRWMYAPWTKECLHCSWTKWSEFDPTTDPMARSGDNDDESIPCLNCGHDIPAGSHSCVACGWTYAQELPSDNPMDRSGGTAAS
jgi:hypothetical protein